MNKILTFLFFLLVQCVTHAGSCGEGKILKIREGAWNTDDLFVQIDYSVSRGDHPGTEWVGEWIIYRKTQMDIERFRGIKAVALAAMVSGRNAYTHTHVSGRCDNASELGIQ